MFLRNCPGVRPLRFATGSFGVVLICYITALLIGCHQRLAYPRRRGTRPAPCLCWFRRRAGGPAVFASCSIKTAHLPPPCASLSSMIWALLCAFFRDFAGLIWPPHHVREERVMWLALTARVRCHESTRRSTCKAFRRNFRSKTTCSQANFPVFSGGF